MKTPVSILLVGRSKAVRNLVERVLDAKHFFLAHADSEAEAKVISNTVHLDLAILDIPSADSPLLAAAEVLRSIRGARFRMIYLVGKAATKSRLAEMVQAGRSWVLRKPFTLQGLLDTVNKALKGAPVTKPKLRLHRAVHLELKPAH